MYSESHQEDKYRAHVIFSTKHWHCFWNWMKTKKYGVKVWPKYGMFVVYFRSFEFALYKK